MFGHEQARLLEQVVRDSDHSGVRRNALRQRQRAQHLADRITVRPHQAARAEFRPAEVARDDHRRIAQAAALQHRQRRAARRPGRFAVVVAVRDHRAAVPHDERRDVVRGVGELGPDARHERLRLVHAEDGRRRRNKPRVDDDDFNARLPRRNEVPAHR